MTRAEKEAQLMAQYFNGSYSDAQFDCTCSGNNPPVRTPTPVVTQPTPTVQEPTPVTTPTMDQQVEDTMNQETVLPPLMPEADPTFPSNQFIEEPQLPSTSDSLISQTGGNENLQNVEQPETKQAGAWMLGLVLAGIALRQLFKGSGKKTGASGAKKVTL